MISGLVNFDLVEILFTLFWIFFIGLVYYLQTEMKREGYPLVSDSSRNVTVQGYPPIPKPKKYKLEDGRTVLAPRKEPVEDHYSAEPADKYPGAPLNPSGDPIMSRMGPGAYAKRSDIPELTLEGKPRIIPMRADNNLHVDKADVDPRGMPVFSADDKVVGTVSDLWIDLAEPQVYFLEVATEVGGSFLVPFGFASVNKRVKEVRINVLYAKQFATVPKIKSPDQITLLEEDQISAYFGGGLLHADESRGEPLI